MVNFKKLILPTSKEVIIYFVLSLIILSVSQFTNILGLLGGDSQSTNSQMIITAFNDQVTIFFNSVNDSSLAAPLSIALFWSAIGIALYLLVNIFRKFWMDVEDDLVVESQFVHPRSYTHIGFWALFAGRVMFRVAMLILLFAYTIFALQLLIPFWINEVNIWINHPEDLQALLNAALALPGMMLTFHIFIIISRMLFLKERVF